LIHAIADLCPRDAETGVGLAIQDDGGRYLFFLAGTRHHCRPGELFYAGIGGHREEGEDWLACAFREAQEEIGTEVEIRSALVTWYIPQRGQVQRLKLIDRPRPLAFYEMIHPPGTPRAGELYRIVIYAARLCGPPKVADRDEVLGIIALTVEQVVRGPERKPTLATLLDEGACMVVDAGAVDRQTRLYPIGTARALAYVLRHPLDIPDPETL
jgi:ADP-ribose pyrophosphatase YjhB (NUDIX family)